MLIVNFLGLSLITTFFGALALKVLYIALIAIMAVCYLGYLVIDIYIGIVKFFAKALF